MLLIGTGRHLSVAVLAILSMLTQSTRTIHLGYFAPFQGSWAGGQQMEAAATLAFEDVNADERVLPGYTLRRSVFDTHCKSGTALLHLTRIVTQAVDNTPIVGFVGPGNSLNTCLESAPRSGVFDG